MRTTTVAIAALLSVGCDLSDLPRPRSEELGVFGTPCQLGCWKLLLCFHDRPEQVSESCVADCSSSLEGDENSSDDRACIDCIVAAPCAEAFPPDGSRGVCAEACGG